MIGIVSYGVYMPTYRVKVEEVAKQWGENPANIKSGLLVEEKSFRGIAVEAGLKAIENVGISGEVVEALYGGNMS